MALEGWGTQVRVEEGKDLNQRKKRHRMNTKSLLYRVYVLSLTLVLLPPRASLVAQRIKRLPAVWETQVRSLGWEGNVNPLQYSCSENPMDRESYGQRSVVGYSQQGHKESDTTERFHFLSFFATLNKSFITFT